VCFFEPALPVFFFSAAYDPFFSNVGLDGNFMDRAEDPNSVDTVQAGSAVELPTAGPVDADTSVSENSVSRARATLDTALEPAPKPMDKGFFVLILKNGTKHAVADYWLVDGYIEYVSRDSTRSHVPLEALDLQQTVTENAVRGLPFVLRSELGDSR
jgi:hypothetical protein